MRIKILIFISAFIVMSSLLSNSFGDTNSLFPDWFKKFARVWVEGGVTDTEFLEAIQWMVDNDVIVLKETNTAKLDSDSSNTSTAELIPDNSNEYGYFSNIVCTPGYNFVEITGKYTNGDIPYSLMFLRMILLDQNGNPVSTGSGTIAEIDAKAFKYFQFAARYPANSQNYTSCDVQIDSAIKKQR